MGNRRQEFPLCNLICSRSVAAATSPLPLPPRSSSTYGRKRRFGINIRKNERKKAVESRHRIQQFLPFKSPVGFLGHIAAFLLNRHFFPPFPICQILGLSLLLFFFLSRL